MIYYAFICNRELLDSNLAAMLQGIYGLQGSFAPCVLQGAVAEEITYLR